MKTKTIFTLGLKYILGICLLLVAGVVAASATESGEIMHFIIDSSTDNGSLVAGGLFNAALIPAWIKDKQFKALDGVTVKALTPEEQIEYYDALAESNDAEKTKLNESITKLSENATANKEELVTLKEELLEASKENLKIQKAQGVALAKLANGSTGIVGNTIKSVRSLLSEKAEAIKNIKDKSLSFIVTKAKEVPGDIAGRSDLAQIIPGVEDLARRAVFMKDLIITRPTDTEYIKKMEQDVVVRDAKNVAQCAVSTHTTKLTWKMTTLQQKKVRDFVAVCIDMMEDYDMVGGEVTDLITYGVAAQVDSQLLLGDGLGDNLNGIKSYASTFAANLPGADYSILTGSPIQVPNVGDLVCVVGAQIEFLGQANKFMPNIAILNPKQIKLLKLTKDKNDQYLLPNFITANGTEVNEIRLIGNPLVPENEMYVGDFTKATIYQAKAANVSMSFENNDNFETECVTIKGYERLNLWVSDNNSNAFMHVPSISAAITAITKP